MEEKSIITKKIIEEYYINWYSYKEIR